MHSTARVILLAERMIVLRFSTTLQRTNRVFGAPVAMFCPPSVCCVFFFPGDPAKNTLRAGFGMFSLDVHGVVMRPIHSTKFSSVSATLSRAMSCRLPFVTACVYLGSNNDSFELLEENSKSHSGHRVGIAHTRWATHGGDF